MTIQFRPEDLVSSHVLKRIQRVKNRKGQLFSLLTITMLGACAEATVPMGGAPPIKNPGFTEDPTGTFTGGDGDDTLNEGDATADLTVDGGAGNDTITTGSGNDIIDGGSGDDTINSGAGDDIIMGGAGADVVDSGAGADLIRGGLGIDDVFGGDGDDIFVLVGITGENQYTQDDITNPGGSGIDLSGILTLETLNGQTESEAVAGEVIDGGAGTNTLVIFGDVDLTGITITNVTTLQINSTVTLTSDQLESFTFVNGNGDSVLVIVVPDGADVNNLDLSGINFSGISELHIFGDASTLGVGSALVLEGVGLIIFDGTTGDDSLTGSALNETFVGGDGNDAFAPNGGDDIVKGGAGVDTVAFSGSVQDYTFTDNGGGHWTVTGPDGTDELFDVEQVSFVNSNQIYSLVENNFPDTVDDVLGVNEGSVLNFTAADLLANDFDFDGDTLSITAVDFPVDSKLLANMTAIKNPDNSFASFSIAAGADFDFLAEGSTYSEVITYTISDGVLTRQGSITITVTGTNDAPVLTGFNTDLALDTAAGALGTVTATDVDTGDSTSFSITAGNDAGLFTIDAVTGEVAAIATLDTPGVHVLTVTGTDEVGDTGDTTVTITIGGGNTSPQVEATKILALGEASGETALRIAAPIDAEGDALAITVTALPTNGVLKLADGTLVAADQALTLIELQGLTFTPGGGSAGSTSAFGYSVDDGNGGVASGTVTTSVAAPATGSLFWSWTPDTGYAFFQNDGGIVSLAGNPPPVKLTTNHGWDFETLGNLILFRAREEGVNSDQLWSFDGQNYIQLTNFTSAFMLNLEVSNGKLIFYTGSQLYWSDGATVQAIPELGTTVKSSGIAFVEIGGVTYLYVDDGGGFDWWEMDGAGAVTLAIDPADAGLPVTTSGDVHYFTKFDATNGRELWVFDGTNELRLTDINPGSGNGVTAITPFSTGVVFTGTDGVNGFEFYFYDGANTIAFDINPGADSSNPARFTSLNGSIYFTANDGTETNPPEDPFTPLNQLWFFDGTNVTKAVGLPFYAIQSIVAFGDTLYIRGLLIDNGTAVLQIWTYDGTTFALMNDFDVLDAMSPLASDGFMAGTFLDGIIYFGGGTFDGTTFTVLANPFGGTASSKPLFLAEYNGELIFSGTDGVTNATHFSTEGNTISALTAADIEALSFSSDTIEFGGKLYFSSNFDTSLGVELYVYDGTTVSLVKDIFVGAGWGLGGNILQAIVFADKLYFRATDGTNGLELWSYDGVLDPVMVADLNPGAGNSNVGGLIVAGAQMLFYATGPSGTVEIWTYDGINPPVSLASGFSLIRDILVIGDTAYFVARDATNGEELWQWGLDGASAPTLVDEIGVGILDSSPTDLIEFNGKLVFAANGTDGTQVYVYDGTGTPTQLSSSAGFAPKNFIVVGTTLYFVADTAANGRELWSYDGTNIQLEVDLLPGTGDGLVLFPKFFEIAGKLVIINGDDIWSYDGITMELLSSGSSTAGIKEVGDKLFISINPEFPDGTLAGNEVWVYDGTTLELIQDLNPTPAPLAPVAAFSDPGAATAGLNLIGGAGNDILVSDTTDDTMTGNGGADTFVFGALWGTDVITDFQDGIDLIDISGTGLTFADLTITQNGLDAVIDDGSGNTITLVGIDIASLNADDFLA